MGYSAVVERQQPGGRTVRGNAHFSCGLPLSARQCVLSKLVVVSLPTVVVIVGAAALFLIAQSSVLGEPPLQWTISWDEFNSSHYLAGAVAYACAMPVTFAAAWYFAARLRRTIVSIILGVVTGPVAMALWAVTGGPGGFLAEHVPPAVAVGLHAALLTLLFAALLVLGGRRAVQNGLV